MGPTQAGQLWASVSVLDSTTHLTGARTYARAVSATGVGAARAASAGGPAPQLGWGSLHAARAMKGPGGLPCSGPHFRYAAHWGAPNRRGPWWAGAPTHPSVRCNGLVRGDSAVSPAQSRTDMDRVRRSPLSPVIPHLLA